jgi:hypothetical protein
VPGGGGISVRNASLILRRGAGSTCEVSNNETGRWASGGIYAEATSEGAMAGFPNLWHAILASVFQFSVMNVAVRGGARVHHNRAMHAGAGDRTGLPRGKGGGLYLIRGDIIDLADLHVRIDDFARSVTDNDAHVADRDQITLVDLEAGVAEEGDAASATRLVGTQYRYDGT